MRWLGLIPARSGSKRVPGKNMRLLGGQPLLAHTIRPALASGIFDRVVVSTNSSETAAFAKGLGVDVPFLRPERFSQDHSPDIEWVLHALETLREEGDRFDVFAILRPTSPFRSVETFRRARAFFEDSQEADSLRAIEPCRQHPGKMWKEEGGFLRPLLDDGGANPPWHSSATQSLPLVFSQNASFEIAWTRVPAELGTIAGNKIVGFRTEGYEGFDINRAEDFLLAEVLVERGMVKLLS